MELKTCSNCKRLFSAESGQRFCSRCAEDVEESFKKVREYIYENPGATIAQVAEDTEMDESVILQYLRQGKLELKGDGVGYGCEHCGVSITTGRFCERCQHELKTGFAKAFGLDKQEEKPGKKIDAGKRATRMHVKL